MRRRGRREMRAARAERAGDRVDVGARTRRRRDRCAPPSGEPDLKAVRLARPAVADACRRRTGRTPRPGCRPRRSRRARRCGRRGGSTERRRSRRCRAWPGSGCTGVPRDSSHVADLPGVARVQARREVAAAEAALVVAGDLPGHERGQTARPEEQQPRAPRPGRAGPLARRAGGAGRARRRSIDVDGDRVHRREKGDCGTPASAAGSARAMSWMADLSLAARLVIKRAAS